MINIFYISKLQIKKTLKILSDSERFELEQFYIEYPFSKKLKIKGVIDSFESYSAINKYKAWLSIETKIQKQKDKSVFILFKKPWYKYAGAAIVVGVLATTFFFKENLFHNPVENSPAIVNTNSIIVPGTDKATLTLEDGSVVALEKGNSYHTKNAKSNGEEIIYKGLDSKAKKIGTNYLTIPRGGQFHLVLVDGTEVWLNSESQLKYPVAFIDGVDRKVELVYGEAYFDVSPSTNHKGSKFKVLNQSQEIEVLGTKFNVKAYKDEANVYTTLVEGKVLIKTESLKKVLKPSGQSNLNLNNNTIEVSQVNVYDEISWKDGVFSFKGKSLKDIMKVISRWYDVEVIFENKNLESVKFKGTLKKNQSIDDILSLIISNSINNYEVKNKTIILK